MATLRDTTIIDCTIKGDFTTWDATIHLGAEQEQHISLGVAGRVLQVLDEQEQNRATIQVGDLDVGGDTNLDTDRISEGQQNKYFREQRLADTLQDSSDGVTFTYDPETKKVRNEISANLKKGGNTESFIYAEDLQRGDPVKLVYDEISGEVQVEKLDFLRDYTNLDIGPTSIFNSYDLVKIEMLSMTRGVLIYQIQDVNGPLAIRSFDVNIDTGFITLNTEILTDYYTNSEYGILGKDNVHVCLAVSRKRLDGRGNPTNIQDTVVVCANVNDQGNISFGNEIVFGDGEVSIDIAHLPGSDKMVVAYRRKNGDGYLASLTSSGVQLDLERTQKFTNSTPDRINIQWVEGNYFVLAYSDLGLNGYGVQRIVELRNNNRFNVGNAAVFISQDLTAQDLSYDVISLGTGSFTTLVIQGYDIYYKRNLLDNLYFTQVDSGIYTYQRELVLVRAISIDESSFALAAVGYDPEANIYDLAIQLGEIVNNSLSFHPEVYPQLFTSDRPQYIDLSIVNDLYISTHNYTSLESQVFRAKFVDLDTRGSFVGFVSESGIAGETHPVNLFYSTTDVFEGLIPNRLYYLSPDLTLTLDEVGPIVGRSISPNRLVVLGE